MLDPRTEQQSSLLGNQTLKTSNLSLVKADHQLLIR